MRVVYAFAFCAIIASAMPGAGKKKKSKAAPAASVAVPITDEINMMIAALAAGKGGQKSFSWKAVQDQSGDAARWRIMYSAYDNPRRDTNLKKKRVSYRYPRQL